MWDETLVPVPISVSSTGWKRHGDLTPGDFVFTPKGTVAKIVRVTEQVVPEVCYAVRFDSGEELVADAEHLWHTWTKRDRVYVVKCTEEWRAKRRAARASRAVAESKKPGVSETVTRLNRERVHNLTAPTGAVRTTQELADTLKIGIEPNHSIPCTAPIPGQGDMPIEPYLFGLWIGDGYSRSGTIGKGVADWAEMGKHCPEPATVTVEFKGRIMPFEMRRFEGLTTQLRQLGVLGSKRIQPVYLRASESDRLALLQGICDTDGTCDIRGQITVGFSNKELATDLLELVGSMGIKATLHSKEAKAQNGRGATHYSMKFVTNLPMFRLPRKAERQAAAKVCKQSQSRFIKEVVRVPSVPMRCIEIEDPDGLYLVSRSFITTHNTSAMIGHFAKRQMQYGKDCRAIWFRRSLPEIEGAQVQMLAMLSQIGGVYQTQPRIWTMPNGATLKLRYLENDQDASRYQGHEYSHIYADDMGTFARPEPVDMLRATLRSAAGVPTQMIASANPGGVGHAWIKARYIDPSRPMAPFVGADGQERVFIPSLLADNPALALADPTYVDRLKASGPEWLVRAWLKGDWDAELDGTLISAEWCEHYYDQMPNRHPANRGRLLVSVDPAEDDKDCNDPTGIIVALHLDATTYLLWAEEVRKDFLALQRHLHDLCDKWGPDVVLIEKKSVGGPIALQLRTRPGWRWATLPVDPGRLSKSQRLWEQTPAMQAGQVRWPRAMPTWARDLRRELLIFPNGPDHRTDALSQMLKYFHKGNSIAGLLAA